MIFLKDFIFSTRSGTAEDLFVSPLLHDMMICLHVYYVKFVCIFVCMWYFKWCVLRIWPRINLILLLSMLNVIVAVGLSANPCPSVFCIYVGLFLGGGGIKINKLGISNSKIVRNCLLRFIKSGSSCVDIFQQPPVHVSYGPKIWKNGH